MNETEDAVTPDRQGKRKEGAQYPAQGSAATAKSPKAIWKVEKTGSHTREIILVTTAPQAQLPLWSLCPFMDNVPHINS